MPLSCSSTSLLTSDNLTLLRPLQPDFKLISLPLLLNNRYYLISSALATFIITFLVGWSQSFESVPPIVHVCPADENTTYKYCMSLTSDFVSGSLKLCTSLSLLFTLCLFTPLCFTINCPGLTLSPGCLTTSDMSEQQWQIQLDHIVPYCFLILWEKTITRSMCSWFMKLKRRVISTTLSPFTSKNLNKLAAGWRASVMELKVSDQKTLHFYLPLAILYLLSRKERSKYCTFSNLISSEQLIAYLTDSVWTALACRLWIIAHTCSKVFLYLCFLLL